MITYKVIAYNNSKNKLVEAQSLIDDKEIANMAKKMYEKKGYYVQVFEIVG